MTWQADRRPGDRLRELEARLRRYHDVGLAEVMDVISYLREEGDRVILGGSLTVGLGNARSDLDVLLVGPPGVNSSRVPLEHWVKSLRIDVWKLIEGQVESAFVAAERGLDSDAPFEGAFGDVAEQAELKLLHRIAFGMQAAGASLDLRTARGASEIACDLLCREYAERMRESAFLAMVAATQEQTVLASTAARAAVEEALHSALAAAGTPFTGDKWLRQRLAESPGLLSDYAPFALLPERPGETPAFVEAAIETCSRRTGVDLSVARLASLASWHVQDLELIPLGEERVLLSRKYGSIWEIDSTEAQAWRRFESADPPCEECDEAEMRLGVELYLAGVAQLRWRTGLKGVDPTRTEVAAA